MINSQIFAYATFAAVMAAPALAHVEPSAHTHSSEFSWLAAALATAAVMSLVILRHHIAAARS